MGTRADFYVGRGKQAEWLGSIAWDGYPSAVSDGVLKAKTEDAYRHGLSVFFSERDDATLPEQGWPWPWDDSNTTDYAYAFEDEQVWATYGSKWFEADRSEPEIDDDTCFEKEQEFPDMSDRKRVARGTRSGLLVLGMRA